ncbi:MAG: flippase-like domain-containing protein [Gemmatimonadaceae bacterium]|nr:flippase-like domain-containing protein [Gemmatimonadaceae bacterium]
MTRARSGFLLGLPLALGAALALWWVRSTGGGTLLRGLAAANPSHVLLAIGATMVWLFARFIRWQFLLRRVGVRLPIRTTLGTYIAGLPGTATPAYLGEAIRGVFIKRRFGVPMRVSLAVLVLERLYDVAALALLTLVVGIAGAGGRAWQVGAAFTALAFVAAMVLWPVGRRIGLTAEAMRRLGAAGTLAPSLALSLIAWSAAGLLFPIAASALGASLPLLDGVRVFGTSTLLGALTLLPAGVGATGSVAILELGRSGFEPAGAVLIVSLVRLTSTGAALALGAVFLWRELRDASRGARGPAEGAAHFDQIAEQYNAQWSPHVWDLLLDRKLGFMAEALPSPPAAAGRGLDLGCGLGLQTAELRKRGYEVIGLDPSVGLLAVGQQRLGPSPVLAGSALELPFADGSLDFVYTIGVLHHLPGRDAQRVAIAEIARVLRHGGVLLVHESNPRNPLFRFYMGYLFPILKSIDEGTEWWIDPRTWERVDGLTLDTVRYFTFLPDFTPKFLLAPAVGVERMLERGPTRAYSAHYMAVLRKPRAATTATQAASAGHVGVEA